MKKSFICSILCLLFITNSHAFSPVSLMITEGDSVFKVDGIHLGIYQYAKAQGLAGEKGARQLAPTDAGFQTLENYLGQSPALIEGQHWIKIYIHNPSPLPQQIVFDGNTEWESSLLFAFDSSTNTLVARQQTGCFMPYDERSGDPERMLMGLTIAPSQTLTCLLLRRHDGFQYGALYALPFTIHRQGAYVHHAAWLPRLPIMNNQLFWTSLVIGALLMMIVYHVITYFSVREISYIHYSLMILGFMLFIVSDLVQSSGLFAINVPFLFEIIQSISLMFGIVFLMQFSRSYLAMRQYVPLWDRITRILIMLGCGVIIHILVVLIFFKDSAGAVTVAFRVSDIWTTITALSGLGTMILSFRYKIRFAGLYTSAFAPTIFTGLLTVPALMLNLANQTETINLVNFSLLAMVMLFSRALSAKINALKGELTDKELAQELERNRLIEQQKVDLVQQVNERTLELREANEELVQTLEQVNEQNKIIEAEREKSDKLLLNILPEETAAELKEKGYATPRRYDMVSVLFTDFKGFTTIAEKLSPEAVTEELNTCFQAFDEIIDRYNLEKIKTIGDSYMCAGGIPVANKSNAHDAVYAALEMQAYMKNLKAEKLAKGEPCWELRLGIHTGAVVAGVIGKNKFAYDIWGDAVNTASRMESSGQPEKVNISGFTYELIKDRFTCSYRGRIAAKGKGEVDMYFVENTLI